MKRIWLCFMFILISSSVLASATIHFVWNYNFIRDPDVHKFNLYLNGKKVYTFTESNYTVENGNSTNATVRGSFTLSPETYHEDTAVFTMTAEDDSGQESNMSEPVTAILVPTLPNVVRIGTVK